MKNLVIRLTIAIVIILSIGYGGINLFHTNRVTECNILKANLAALSGSNGEYDYSDGYPYSTICNVAISKNKRCKVEIIICQGGGKGCNEKKCPVH